MKNILDTFKIYTKYNKLKEKYIIKVKHFKEGEQILMVDIFQIKK